MAFYTVWVGGSTSYSRSYLGELGAYKLTEAQIRRWLPGYLEKAGYDVETGEMWLNMSRDWGQESEEDDLPRYCGITDGRLGWGAYNDQTFGVEDGDGEVIWTCELDELRMDHDEESKEPRLTSRIDEDHMEGVWIVYNFSEKGGWSTEIEIPDDEEFDFSELVFHELEVDGLNSIITSISYKGEDYTIDADSDGKGNDYYLVVDGEFYTLS